MANELVWDDYTNEIARVKGRKAKTRKLIFTILPDEQGISLRIQDAYSGELVRSIRPESFNDAISISESIHHDIERGHTLDEIFRQV
jgi:hypothetical protein